MTNINPAVQTVYENLPEPYRSALLTIRSLIYEVAAELSITEPVEESLKWGQPSYSVKSGTPIKTCR